jgi:acetyl esterase/lipase
VAGGVSLKLDVALPPGPGPFPGVIMIHGGGWDGGDKTDFRPALPTYLARGVACFAVDYRLSSQAVYPAAVDDCLAAVRWVRGHAAEFKLDPDRLAVMGGSAGGHLSWMVATATPTAQDLNAQGKRLKSLVVAVASLSGPTDMTALMHPSPDMSPAYLNLAKFVEAAVSKFLGGQPQDIPDTYAAASPITRVTADCPPALLVHGTADELVPYAQSTMMVDKLMAIGVPFEMVPIVGGHHAVAGLNALPQVVEFLVRHLAAPAS